MIASDAGLLESAVTLTRIRLSPGERAEILLDLQGMTGQTMHLTSFSSELPNGVYGAKTVRSMMGGTIPDYNLNPLNGKDFDILQINVVAQTTNPITTLPAKLVADTPWKTYTVSREFNLRPDTMMSAIGQVAGPFNINGAHFDMDVINTTTYLHTAEKWRISNNTGIAHPFHKHDLHFYLLNVNGAAVPEYERGKKDVVLVMPMQYVEFVTKFEDYANSTVPYMFHCHLLHHEDDGMMGSFRVIDTSFTGVSEIQEDNFAIYPNPATNILYIQFKNQIPSAEIKVLNVLGETVLYQTINNVSNTRLDIDRLNNGIYFLQIIKDGNNFTRKFTKQ